MDRGLVVRALRDLGGSPVWRQGYGNLILDVHGLQIVDPPALEYRINNIVGVVCCGIFAAQAATRVLMAGPEGVVSF